jgi:hypothetical protein
LRALVLVATSKVLDVVLHDRDQSSVGEVAAGHPKRQLRVPNQIMAANLELVRLCEGHVAVRVFEGKVVARGLG